MAGVCAGAYNWSIIELALLGPECQPSSTSARADVTKGKPTVPTYQYACTACDHRFEIFQAFSDSSLTTCPECQGKLRKLFGSVGIVFKGSGFYRTDSRANGSGASGDGRSDSSNGESKSGKSESSSGDSGSSSSGSSGSSGSDSSGSSGGEGSAKSSNSSSGATQKAS